MKIRVRNTIKLDIEGKVKTYGPSRTVYKIDDKVAKEKNYSKRFKKYPEHIEIVEDEEVVVVDMTPPPDQEEEKEQETVSEDSKEDSPTDKPKKKKAAPKKKKKDEE